MDVQQLINQGNQHRSDRRPDLALACYAQAFVANPEAAAAWNNYGNVLRECGQAGRSIPFLQHAIELDPSNATAQFNLAVSLLALGRYAQGWSQYEHRWNFEHLAGTLPNHSQPRWQGQDLQGQRLLILGEQGHGDNIQFMRFLFNLHAMGARITYATTDAIRPMLEGSPVVERCVSITDTVTDFDLWCPLMSVPGIMGVTLENLPRPVSYLTPRADLWAAWHRILGAKRRMRVGLAWSGRKDNWLNAHKSIPFDQICDWITANPSHEWINLQVDCAGQEQQQLDSLSVRSFPGQIHSFADSAALVSHCDVVITVDTAVAHLSAALGRPTWLMLNWFAPCWRWLQNRQDSPWYPTMRIFRQSEQDQWQPVLNQVQQYLHWFKV